MNKNTQQAESDLALRETHICSISGNYRTRRAHSEAYSEAVFLDTGKCPSFRLERSKSQAAALQKKPEPSLGFALLNLGVKHWARSNKYITRRTRQFL